MLKHSPCRDGHRSIIVFFLAKKLKNERSDLWRIKQNRIHGSRLSAMPSQIILGLMLRIIAMYTPSAALPRNEALDPRKTLRSYTPLQAKTNAKNYARKFAALKECYKYAKRCQTCLFSSPLRSSRQYSPAKLGDVQHQNQVLRKVYPAIRNFGLGQPERRKFRYTHGLHGFHRASDLFFFCSLSKDSFARATSRSMQLRCMR